MAQLTLIILLAIAGWLGWWRFKQERARLAKRRAADRANATGRSPEAGKITLLEKDPKTGVYRPVDRER